MQLHRVFYVFQKRIDVVAIFFHKQRMRKDHVSAHTKNFFAREWRRGLQMPMMISARPRKTKKSRG